MSKRIPMKDWNPEHAQRQANDHGRNPPAGIERGVSDDAALNIDGSEDTFRDTERRLRQRITELEQQCLDGEGEMDAQHKRITELEHERNATARLLSETSVDLMTERRKLAAARKAWAVIRQGTTLPEAEQAFLDMHAALADDAPATTLDKIMEAVRSDPLATVTHEELTRMATDNLAEALREPLTFEQTIEAAAITAVNVINQKFEDRFQTALSIVENIRALTPERALELLEDK